MRQEPSLPPEAELRRFMEEGRTHAEIRVECERVAGRRFANATTSAMLSRASMTTKEGHRYFESIPWRIRPEHATEYAARMLRLLGRRRTGVPLSDDDTAHLDSWLGMLERERLVVAYRPDAEEGFRYVDEELRSGPNPDIPIRVQPLPVSLA